ncbi:MAG: DUF2764 family protein [Bacteroidales bacterium]|nr:DUF2764 family protein [Bacteroidales bacterium]
MSRNYYCLIAGMPDIAFEQKKAIFKQLDFKNYLKEELAPADYAIIEHMYLVYDNKNLLALLEDHGNAEHNPLGNYSKEQLSEALKEPEGIAPYLITFINEYKDSDDKKDPIYWEKRLTLLYYEYIKNISDKFLKQWFDFEFTVNTIITALSARQHGRNIEDELIITGEDIIAIAKSNSKNFGLSVDFPAVESLISIYEQDNLLKREESLDMFLWQWLDEHTVFEYFSLAMIASLVIKIRIADRWTNIDPEKGAGLFRKILEDIKAAYNFNNIEK